MKMTNAASALLSDLCRKAAIDWKGISTCRNDIHEVALNELIRAGKVTVVQTYGCITEVRIS